MNSKIFQFIRNLYDPKNSGRLIPLHEPVMGALEKEFVNKCIDSTFVSSVGEYVGAFEKAVSEFTKIPFAVATTNGTSALHLSLVLLGARSGDEVLTQALTFVATANAIKYCDAHPVFVDSAKDNLGMCPEKLEEFLNKNTFINNSGECINKKTNRRIPICVPMHVFGHPVDTKKIKKICDTHNIKMIEDAAEALGTYQDGKHVGHVGDLTVLSFNGNKIVTAGGGGMILTSSHELAKKAKHLSTTAKIPHKWEFNHDQVGYNYRMPNLNAAFGCAQMQQIPTFLTNKRETASIYKSFFEEINMEFLHEPQNAESNFWLNTILVNAPEDKEKFLNEATAANLQCRPVWKLMSDLNIYKECSSTNLERAHSYESRIVNIPSSVRDSL